MFVQNLFIFNLDIYIYIKYYLSWHNLIEMKN